jgi:putative transposase
MTFGFIEAERAIEAPLVRAQWRVPGFQSTGCVASSGSACLRQQQDMVYLAHIRTAFALSNGTYGSPRM